jgi:putative salt-induced outer membrane protein YdiY
MRAVRAAVALVVLMVGLLPADARAQAQPAAPAAPAGPPPEREGSAEFAFVGTSGNSSTQTIGVGGEYIYRPDPWETRFKLRYVRNESDDEVKAQSFVLTLRGQRPIRPKLAGYAQYGYQRDRFAGILNRNAIEAGLAYSWIEQAPHKLVVDAGLGYANETRLVGSDLSTATLGTGALYTLKISGTTDLSEDGRFVFSLSDGSDWRYANLLSLTAKMTTIFSLKASNAIRYVNQPVLGFETTDAITSIALVARF